MTAIFDDEVFDHIGAVAGIDADAAYVDLSCLARSEFVELEHVATLQQHDFADGAVHSSGHFGVQLELAVLAVDGNEVFRFDQVDDELEFVLAGVPADVDGRRSSVLVDDVGLAAKEVIDHAVDGFLVAGDDAARKHDGIALFDFGVLVIIDGGARQGRHGLALRAADQHADFFGREILHLPGIDHEAVGDFDVAEVFGDFGGVVHGAAEECDFAAVLVRQFDGQADAMNGRRKTGNEQPPLGVRKNFVKLAPHGSLAGRVALALDVGRILKQRQHALLAVLGEGVQIERVDCRWAWDRL